MSQALLLSDPVPTVSLYDGRPATTSQEVARYFNKRHDNVVRDVRSLVANTPERFRALNFEETLRTVPGPNNSERQEAMYIIYRDGFMLLVMGYTGKKALAVKLAYIEAFNAMEAQLSTSCLPASPSPLTRSTIVSRKPLEKLIRVWASQAGMRYAHAWTQVNAHFGLEKIGDLPAEWIPDAIAFVEAKISELPKALPTHVKPATPPAQIDESPFIEFINEVQAAHEEVDRILTRLHHSVFTLSWKVAEALEKRGDIRAILVPDMAFDSTLRGYLCHNVYHDVRRALTAPGRQLEEYSNPGYPLLGIVRQLNAR